MLLQNLILAAAVLFFVGACGSSTSNSSSVFDSDTGSHVAGWLPQGHSVAAKADMTVCTECHGSDFTGGVAGVACTQCHLEGPETVHLAAWSQNTGTYHGPYAAANGTGKCSNVYCHGTGLTGVARSGPSCTSCHLGGPTSVHPTDWTTDTILTKHGPYELANGAYSCQNVYCHGGYLQGVAGSGPSCHSCHSFP